VRVGLFLVFFMFDTNKFKETGLDPLDLINNDIGNGLLLMLAQMQLLDLVLKVNEHELKLIQELVVDVLCLAITDDNDALI
jgi:hypothetical protein